MWRNFKFLYMIDVEKSKFFSTCGVISHFTTWQMWINLKSPSLCVQFMVFCCILRCFVAKSFVFCDLRCFFRKIGLLQFTRYCVEKILAEISDCGEKITNMRYGKTLEFLQSEVGKSWSWVSQIFNGLCFTCSVTEMECRGSHKFGSDSDEISDHNFFQWKPKQELFAFQRNIRPQLLETPTLIWHQKPTTLEPTRRHLKSTTLEYSWNTVFHWKPKLELFGF